MAVCARCSSSAPRLSAPESLCEACLLSVTLTQQSPVPDEEFGPYQILCEIGEGGLGVVYLAQQLRPIRREVALKAVKHGAAGPEVRARFEAECQALARLNHPNIAQIYDVGTSTLGRQFFTMEFVDGAAITDYCDSRKLTVAARVAMIIDVCHSVEFAHSQGILHRDLKPSNILVKEIAGRCIPKVIDFGIARALDSHLSGMDRQTRAGLQMGTIEYMSPEQAASTDQAVVSSDVYSLGAVLYEFLAGALPFDSGRLRNAGPLGALRIVTEENVPPLHEALRGPHAESIAQRRGTSVAQLERELSGGLAAIVGKAIRKDPRERYESAAALADDLKRYLSGVPVHALALGSHDRPPASMGARLSRRWIVTSAALGVAAAGAYFWRSRPVAPLQVLVDEGHAADPAFSPDGARIAFSWKPPKAPNYKLFLINTRRGRPQEFTTGPGDDIDPAWSPAGTSIAFVRHGAGENALYVKPIGEPERRVATLTSFPFGGRLDWLSDNRSVIVAELDGPGGSVPRRLLVLDTETGQRRVLTNPSEPPGDEAPIRSPDGATIAFTRGSDVCIVPVRGGDVKRLTFHHQVRRNIRWSPDGRGILYKSRLRSHLGLWQVTIHDGASREVVLPRVADGRFDVRAASDGTIRMATADAYDTVGISRFDIPSAQGQARQTPLILSGKWDTNPAISPDGLKIAFVSTRANSPEIWLSDSEGADARQLTSFGGPPPTQPAWSPDGRSIIAAAAPNGQGHLLSIDIGTGALRWLTTEGNDDTEPQWSRDGRWITFASSRSGTQELWRMAAAGGPARRLTRNGGSVHRESPDGRWIYYVRHSQPGLFRMPFEGGQEQVVLDRVTAPLYRAWAVGRSGIYYTSRDGSANRWIIAHYDLASQAERIVATIDRPLPRWSGTLSLSPDERRMVLPLHEAEGSRLLLLSGVRI